MDIYLKLALSWARVRFKDPALEREFLHSKYRKLLFRLRMVAVSTFLLGLLELRTYELRYWNVQVISLSVSCVVSLSMTSLTFFEKFKHNPVLIRLWSCMFWILTSVTLMGMRRMREDFDMVDWSLLSLIPTILLAVKVPVLDGFAVSLVIICIFVGFIEFTFKPATTVEFVACLLLITVMAFYGAHYVEKKERRAFLAFHQWGRHTRHVMNRTATADRLLHNVFPHQIVEQLKNGAKANEINKTVKSGSIVFICVKSLGFDCLPDDDSGNVVDEDFMSSAALHLAHNTLVQLNNEFAKIEKLCELFQVEKIKTIGNIFMAGCGFPEERQDHGIWAADFCHAVTQYASSRCLAVQIGFHIGTLVAGVLACNVSYDVWGDTVNTSSRLCTHGAFGKVHISEAVREALGATEYVYQDRGVIEMKGKGPMRTFFLAGKRDGLSCKRHASLQLNDPAACLGRNFEQSASNFPRKSLGQIEGSTYTVSKISNHLLSDEEEDLGPDIDMLPGTVFSSSFKRPLHRMQSYLTTHVCIVPEGQGRSQLMSLVTMAASSVQGPKSRHTTAAESERDVTNDRNNPVPDAMESPRGDVSPGRDFTVTFTPRFSSEVAPLNIGEALSSPRHQRRHGVLCLSDLTFNGVQSHHVLPLPPPTPQADTISHKDLPLPAPGLWTRLELVLFETYEALAYGGQHTLDETERKHYHRVQSAMSRRTFRFLDPSVEAAFWTFRWQNSSLHFRWFVAILTMAATIVQALERLMWHADQGAKLQHICSLIVGSVLAILASFSPYWRRHPRLCVIGIAGGLTIYFSAVNLEDFIIYPDHISLVAPVVIFDFVLFNIFIGVCPANSFLVVIPLSAVANVQTFWMFGWDAAIINCFMIAVLASLHLERAARFLFLSTTYEQAEAVKLVELRKRTEEILFSVLPERIVNSLRDVPECSSDSCVMETFCNLSVVAMDIVQFTVLSGNLKPTTLVTMLEDVFATFDELAMQFDVHRVKTIGDCYVAFTSGPKNSEEEDVTHTYRITCFASACLKFLESYHNTAINTELGCAYRLNMRAGIGTGTAIAGVIGTKRLRYDIWGPAVDRAFHEEETSVSGHVKVCSQSLLHLNKYAALTTLNSAPYTVLPSMGGALLKPSEGAYQAS